jgi:ATP-dependent Clp protease ATP-binding subunit ClpC
MAIFDRYTETARRAIFFARYEASRYGSEEIDDVELLMGVLTADQALASRLEELGFGVAAIRGQLVPTGKTVGTNIDLPLSSTAQQVLMFATDEADRVDSSTIQPSHLLTAIAQMESGRAAEMLAASGLTPDRLRDIVSSP